jgi:hypothetical protein
MFNYSDYKEIKTGYTSISGVGNGNYNSDLDLSRYAASDNDELGDSPRPFSITLIVWYHIIGALVLAALFFFVTKSLPSYSALVWLLSVVGNGILVISLVGLWNMKKYGAVTFVIQIFLSFLVDMLTKSEPSYISLFILVIMTAFIFLEYKEMR